MATDTLNMPHLGVAGRVNLQKFCAIGDVRTYLNQPWKHKGWHIGADGWILVAIPHSAPDVPDTPEVPDGTIKVLDSILSFDFEQAVLIDASAIALPAAKACVECDATGSVSEYLCSDCEGSGDCETYGGDCSTCDGAGYLISSVLMTGPGVKQVHCMSCFGSGHGNKNDVIRIGEVNFSACLVRRLLVLPDLVFAVDATTLKANFRFWGGVGALAGRWI